MFSKSLVALVYSLMPTLHPAFPEHAVPFHFAHAAKDHATSDPSDDSGQYADPLPIPEHIQAIPFRRGKPAEITLTMSQFTMSMHSALPDQTEWGYNGTTPGPVIDVEKDQDLIVHWKNSLPTTHMFPAPDQSLAISLGLCLPNTPDVRTVTHLHGAEVSEADPNDRVHNNDGWPDAWTIPGQEQIAEYPNHQAARTLWYHDHAMGTTGRNVASGLVGIYLIHDDYERSLGLPSGAYDIPLLIRSHSINDSGLLQYANDVNLEMYGNSVSVNGKLWPYLDVEPRKYRFRLINGSNARSYAMKLVGFEDENTDGPALEQIASDSGFLAKPVEFNTPGDPTSPRLFLAPGERAEIIVDFSQYAGKNLLMHNTSRDAGDGEIAMPGIMEFRVTAAPNSVDTSVLPKSFKAIPRIAESEATVSRRIVLAEAETPKGDKMLILNGKSWNDKVEEIPKLGSTEIWELTNTLPDVHPFHMHLVQFQILDRTPFDADKFLQNGTVTLTGAPQPPDENEMGWKDTVRATGNTVTRIIMRFLPYPGYYVYHCHILEHEDMDMMRPFQVVP